MGRKKSKNQNPSSQPLSTLVENPFGIHTPEILDAQNIQEELDLDADLHSEDLRGELEAHLQDLLKEEAELEELENEDSDPAPLPEEEESLDPESDSLTHEQEEELIEEEGDSEISSPEEDAEESPSDEPLEDQDDPAANPDHLLESELREEGGDLELSEEDTQWQLEKIAQAITQQVSEDLESLAPLVADASEEQILQAQIAEDLALQAAQKEMELQGEAAEESITEKEMDQEELQSCIEALLFISDKPLSREKLKSLLGPTYDMGLFDEALQALAARYQGIHHGIELTQVGGGYQFRTKPGRADLARKLVRTQTQRLSSGCMETLAIVAYRQPVMKEDIDQVRGVDSSYFIRGLLEKKLIHITGRSELPGRPLLYETTPEFLELFSLNDLSSLPSLREIEQMIPTSQSQNPDEDPKTRELRRLVGEMKADQSTTLYYNPKEDEKILKEIKDQVTAIPVSTPYLDELRAAELAAKEQEKQLKAGGNSAETLEIPPVAAQNSDQQASLESL